MTIQENHVPDDTTTARTVYTDTTLMLDSAEVEALINILHYFRAMQNSAVNSPPAVDHPLARVAHASIVAEHSFAGRFVHNLERIARPGIGTVALVGFAPEEVGDLLFARDDRDRFVPYEEDYPSNEA